SVNGKKNDGQAKETVQVLDVAQLLLDSVKTPENPEGPHTPPGPQGPADPRNAPEPEPAQ
ncbi:MULTISPECIES: hypothetical protein, partial [unclassified Streptomyces]|uniref:hypothetical protein n=1 Tax=unclassified Streptomyces TaxID=2593676 RepID=UPI00365CA943